MITKWVFACGARRSGSTLQYNLARDIVELGGGLNKGWITWQNFDAAFDRFDGKHEYILVKCHVHMPTKMGKCGQLWKRGRGYGVFVHRNMFDAMASMLRLNEANIKSPPPSLIKEDVIATIKEITAWLDTSNVLVSRYADIISDDGRILECARIAKHIGIEVSDEECTEIARRYSIDEQRKRMQKTGMSSGGLWPKHIATGEVGVWRDELTPEQIDFCRIASSTLHDRLGYHD